MNEQPLNLRRLLRVLGRGTWIIVLCAVLGMVAAVGVRVVRSPLSFTGRASVLLPTSAVSADGQPQRDASTEVQIARSQAVLDGASRTLRAAGFRMTTTPELKSRLKVSA